MDEPLSSDNVETAESYTPPFKPGDRVKHSSFYLRMMRGEHRKKAETVDYEVMACTNRSVTVRPWGSTQKYGPQFPHRYIELKQD